MPRFAAGLLASALLAVVSGASGSAANKANGRILLLSIGGDCCGLDSDATALYSVNRDGTGLQRIAGSIHRKHLFVIDEDIGGRWSPDGKRVAFVRSASDCSRYQRCPAVQGLYVANADGRSARRLVKGTVRGFDWSPDGRKIVLAREDVRARQLYVVTLRGALRRITKPRAWPGDWSPTWSPNGRLIAFVRIYPGGRSDEVWVVRPAGRKPRRVARTSRGETVSGPEWSADSRFIAYRAWSVASDVYVVRPNGNGKADITPEHDGTLDEPRWAPNGTAIAYGVCASYGANGPIDDCDSRRIAIQRTLSSPREFIDENDSGRTDSYAWSPDATAIAFGDFSPAHSGVYLKTIGQPGLDQVLPGSNWFVFDWAPRA